MTESEVAINERRGWLGRWFQWSPTSMKLLQEAEQRILSYVKTKYVGRYVNIGNKMETKSSNNEVWTVSMNEESDNTPLVLVHGFGSGVALWALNLDSLASKRPVYAFDILGFGRSSRPSFDSDPIKAENQFVESIEDWREAMGLKRFILLGHSMGGFLVSSYAIKHPERVQHLILADPWGYEGVKSIEERNLKIPLFIRFIFLLIRPFNPLAGIRAAGPCGPKLITKLRSDIPIKYASIVDDEAEVITNYIYHCNAQTPSGESAFKSMTEKVGWARNPMIDRIETLNKEVPITFIYGAKSWMDRKPGYETKNLRNDSKVVVYEISGAGHHVYADKYNEFNVLVNKVCERASQSRCETNEMTIVDESSSLETKTMNTESVSLE